LIEVLCAILVLGVGIVGLTQGLTTALQSSKESEVQTAAVLIAAGRIETLRAEGYLVEGIEESEGESKDGYRWQQVISRTDIEGLHDVKVVVQHGKSAVPVYELRTLLFDPPLLSSSSPTQNQRETESKRHDRRLR
jgi:Tfp pilus assembly protein PilV